MEKPSKISLYSIIPALFNLCLGITYDNMVVFATQFNIVTGIFVNLDSYGALICIIRNYLEPAF